MSHVFLFCFSRMTAVIGEHPLASLSLIIFKSTLPPPPTISLFLFSFPLCGCDRCIRRNAPSRWGRVLELVSANSRTSGRGFEGDSQSLGPIAEDYGRGPGCGRCVRRYESPAAHYPSRRVNGTSVALRCLDQLHSAREKGGNYGSTFLFFFLRPFFLALAPGD